jgi:streptogramin lyase
MGLTALANDCTTNLAGIVCTIDLALQACPSSSVCYSAQATTYDGYDASANTIPEGADVLSVAAGVPFSVTKGKANAVSFALSGVPASVVAVPVDSSSTVTGSTITVSGFTQHPFYVYAKDVDGAIITGLGSPNFSVAASPAPGLTLTQPATGTPRFSITNPSHAANFLTPTPAITLTAAYAADETDGCAQPTSVCTGTYTVAIPSPMTFYAQNIITGGEEFVDALALGPDGNIWFASGGYGPAALGRVTTSGVSTSLTSNLPTNGPMSMTTGPDGNLWITQSNPQGVSKLASSGSVIAQYTSGITANAYPQSITAGPDGNLWFVEGSNKKIAKITTAGTVTEYGSAGISGTPNSIVAGPDGNMWFTENNDKVASVTTSGAITEYANGITQGSYPYGIVAGHDGNLWFTEAGKSAVAKISTSGAVTQYPFSSTENTGYIAAGPDGNVWFVDYNTLYRITPSGALTAFALPSTLNTGISQLAFGSDGNLWFWVESPEEIGVLTL